MTIEFLIFWFAFIRKKTHKSTDQKQSIKKFFLLSSIQLEHLNIQNKSS